MEKVNPLKRIRLNQHYSIDRLSSEYSISRQLIINNEAGQYHLPSPALLAALKDLTDFDTTEVMSDYRNYQTHIRKANYGKLCTPLPIPSSNSRTHPVVHWANASNIPYTRISKLFCVHQGLMDRLKNQPNLMNYLPSDFTHALLESGYSRDLIGELELRFRDFKDAQRQLVSS